MHSPEEEEGTNPQGPGPEIEPAPEEPTVNDLVLIRDLLRLRPNATGAAQLRPELLSRLVISLKGPHGQELAIPLDEIEIDARNPQRFRRPRKAQNFTVCGNCSARITRTGDATEDHHAAMRHAVEECTSRAQAQDEHRELVTDFTRQQQQLSPATWKLLTGGAARNQARPRPWWKFWDR